MARIRSIHPGIWTDEDFIEVGDKAKLLFIGLWNEADDRGIFEWKVVMLKMRLRPWDGEDVNKILFELSEKGMIFKFEVGAKNYGAVRNFCRWQRPKSPQYLYPCPPAIEQYVRFEQAAEAPERGTALGRMLCDAQSSRCHYCGEAVTFYRKRANSLEVDHKIPISRGGDDAISNLVASCKPCNGLKGGMTDAEFREKFAVETLIANSRSQIAKRSSQIAKNTESVVSLECDEGVRNGSRRSQNQMEDGGGSKGSSQEKGNGRVEQLHPREVGVGGRPR